MQVILKRICCPVLRLDFVIVSSLFENIWKHNLVMLLHRLH